MIITNEHLQELMKQPRNKEAISSGVDLQKRHKVHVTGEGYESLVRQVDGWETSRDFNVRKQISKPATINITSIIIDNLNRWVTAQGTVKKVKFEDTAKIEAFQKVLESVWNNQSFENYISTFHKIALYTEFNGFVIVTKPKIIDSATIERNGVVMPRPQGNLSPYMIFVSIADVHDYYLSGDKVEYIIIKLGNNQFRLIDDARDTVFTYSDTVKDFNDLPNEIGYVPARMISNISHRILSSQVKTSPIDHIIPALDRYMSSDCDLRMAMIKHNYPKLAIVTRECTSCHGTGWTYDQETRLKCNNCDGTGKEIPISRDGVIGIPANLEQGDTPYPGAPATYITPDTESLRLAFDDLKAQREDIIYSGTGDKNLIAESLNTATENSINIRSLEDRITEITDGVEQFERFIKTAIRDMHKDFASAAGFDLTIKYGRRIMTKGENDLMSEIKQAKEANMSSGYILGLQKDLIVAKYRNNKDDMQRQMMLVDIEPFAAYRVDELQSLTGMVIDDDLKLKINFDSLIDEWEAENGPVQLYDIENEYAKRVVKIKTELYALLQKRIGSPVPGG